MWRSQVQGQDLHFRLLGVNNQNFLMEDEQTGTWWQQVTGAGVQGPQAGAQLEPMPFEIIAFGIWRSENPAGVVLSPEQEQLENYARADWVESLRRNIPVPDELVPAGEFAARELVVGVEVDGRSKAYPLALLAEQSPVADRIGSVPLLLVVAGDGRSVRAFDRRLDGKELELYGRDGSDPPILIDAGSGSEFDFRGTAVSGPLQGQSLARVSTLTEFWFDWHAYHPDTWTYQAGARTP